MIPQTKRHILFLRKKDVFIYYSGINRAVYGSAFSYSPNAAALFKKM